MPEPAADIVILLHHDGRDPRGENDVPVPVRATLHAKDSRVLVEVGVGVDAVGAARWRRIDDKKRREVRGAYDVVERLLATWYARAIDAERRVADAERRAAQAEAKARGGARPPVLIAADPKAHARERLMKLLTLACESSNDNEARTAALAAARLMREQGFEAR